MEYFLSSIHVLSKKTEAVLTRLGLCWDSVGEDMEETLNGLKKEMEKSDSQTIRLIKLLRFLKKQEEKTVTFHSIACNGIISIYSDYINVDNVFEFAQKCFEDINEYVLAFGSTDQKIQLSVYKKGKKQTSFVYDGSFTEGSDGHHKVLSKFGFAKQIDDDYFSNCSAAAAVEKLEKNVPFKLIALKDEVLQNPAVETDEYYI